MHLDKACSYEENIAIPRISAMKGWALLICLKQTIRFRLILNIRAIPCRCSKFCARKNNKEAMLYLSEARNQKVYIEEQSYSFKTFNNSKVNGQE